MNEFHGQKTLLAPHLRTLQLKLIPLDKVVSTSQP